MKRIAAFFFCILFGLSLFGCGETPAENTDSFGEGSVENTDSSEEEPIRHYVGLTDQVPGRIVVYDLDVEDWTSEEALVWEYPSGSCGGLKFRNCEFWGGEVVIFSGDVGIGLVSYETKELLWTTRDVPLNPHSVEVLPNGNIACAGSTGNSVRIYGASQRTADCFHSDIYFPDAHGLLWDPSLEVLWAYGASKLAAYKVTGTDAQPTLTPVEGMEYLVPDGNGHDLAPVYGDTDRLWLTGGGRTKQFVKSTGEFVTDFPGSSAMAKDVKGVGNFPDNRVVYTYPNGNYRLWTTDLVYFYQVNDAGTRVVGSGSRFVKTDAYYKVRVWISDYQ